MSTAEYVSLNATVADDYFHKSHDGKPFHLGENRTRTFAIVHIPSIPVFGSGSRLEPGTGIFVTRTFPKFSNTPCISPSPITFFECANHHPSSSLQSAYKSIFSCALIGSARPTVKRVPFHLEISRPLSVYSSRDRNERSRSPSRSIVCPINPTGLGE